MKHVTFDCADPAALARFWADVAGGEVSADWGEFVVLAPGISGVRHVAFGRVREGNEFCIA